MVGAPTVAAPPQAAPAPTQPPPPEAAPAAQAPTAQAPAAEAPVAAVNLTTAAKTTAPKGPGTSAKIAIAAVLAVIVLIGGWVILDRLSQNRDNKIYNQLVALGADPETVEVPMNRKGLDIMLRAAMDIKSNSERGAVYQTLILASPTDGTDIDLEIVNFATTRTMVEDIREMLITLVLGRRGNPVIVTPLLDFAEKTDKTAAAIASVRAVRRLVDESHFDRLLNTVQFTGNVEMRRAAEEAITEIFRKTSQPEKFASKLHGIYRTAGNDEARHAAVRLAGRIADASSLDLIREILDSGEVKDKIAAISALSTWGNGEGFPVLINFFNTTEDQQLRSRAFEAAMRYATALDERQADAMLRQDVWSQLSLNARTSEEQERVVRGLAINDRDEWVVPLLQGFTRETNPDRVIDVAERAIRSVNERRRNREAEK